MEHIYSKLGGWFDFPKFYSHVINTFSSGSTLIEIGTYEGMSLSYLVVEAINSGKEFNIIGIDNFGFEGLREKYDSNIEPIKDKIKTIHSGSWEAASKFEDKSVDFVFIDANHTYDAIRKDIDYWLPKIKPGGMLSGHDYNEDWHVGVKKAVDETFKDKVNLGFNNEGVWYVIL